MERKNLIAMDLEQMDGNSKPLLQYDLQVNSYASVNESNYICVKKHKQELTFRKIELI